MRRHGRGAAGAMAALATVGFLDAVYMLAFTEGVIERIACPFFGNGCATVGRSPHARTFGVPHAAVGAVGYAVMAVLALLRSEAREPALVSTAGSAAAASVYLTWKQAARVRAWCFWCLTSAFVNMAILVLSVLDARRAWSTSWRRR